MTNLKRSSRATARSRAPAPMKFGTPVPSNRHQASGPAPAALRQFGAALVSIVATMGRGFLQDAPVSERQRLRPMAWEKRGESAKKPCPDCGGAHSRGGCTRQPAVQVEHPRAAPVKGNGPNRTHHQQGLLTAAGITRSPQHDAWNPHMVRHAQNMQGRTNRPAIWSGNGHQQSFRR